MTRSLTLTLPLSPSRSLSRPRKREQRRRVERAHQVEVRDVALGLGEPRRDPLAHVRRGDVGVVALGVGRHLARVAHGDRLRRLRSASSASTRPRAARLRAWPLPPPSAAARTSRSTIRPPGPVPCDRAQVDAELDRERLRERGGEELAAGRGFWLRACFGAGGLLRARPAARAPSGAGVSFFAAARSRSSGLGALRRRRVPPASARCRRRRTAAALLRLLDQRADVLAGLADDRDRRAELDRVAFLDEQLQQDAVVLDVEVHVRLVGLDLGDQVTRRNLVAFLLRPPDEDAFFHRRRQLRQSDDLGHGVYSR